MALVIKGDMPKACNWFDENGKHRFCKVNAFCDCRIYARGKRPSDCPILGEIPDEYGRLIDADELEKAAKKMVVCDSYEYTIAHEMVKGLLKIAPTVLEAST